MPLLVDEESRLSQALDLHDGVLGYIVSLAPHGFERLYKPLMRRLLPPRVTLSRVSRMTGTPIAELRSGRRVRIPVIDMLEEAFLFSTRILGGPPCAKSPRS